MSCYVVSDLQINKIVSTVRHYCRLGSREIRYQKSENFVRSFDLDNNDHLKDLAGLLHDENLRSFYFRYPSEKKEMPRVVDFPFKRVEPCKSQLEFLSLLDNYDYQACECDDYEQSDAYKIVQAMTWKAIRSMPDYDKQPWGIA